MKPIIAIFGNCQVGPIADCLTVMLPHYDIRSATLAQIRGGLDARAMTAGASHVFCHLRFVSRIQSLIPEPILSFPEIMFSAFHPDSILARGDGGEAVGPLGGMNSALVLEGFKAGLSREETARTFTPEAFAARGYLKTFSGQRDLLLASGDRTDVPIRAYFDRWAARAPFMHAWHHPKLFVLADVARALAEKVGETPATERPEEILRDTLLESLVWPVYPGIAEVYGLKGDYAFRMRRPGTPHFGLEEMIDISFTAYEGIGEITADLPEVQLVSNNPYRHIPPHQKWRSMQAALVDPVVQPLFRIDRKTSVATAGSCFAQHIARTLARSGFNYYVAETGDPAKQYGLFSARYGNIYSARQLLQLFRRAYGRHPTGGAWPSEGRLLDPFRPTVEPGGYETIEALEQDRDIHLGRVREMFETLDVFVFTLGLTEAWEDEAGTVYPVAPGTVSDEPMAGYRFVNYSVEDVQADMRAFIHELRTVNPTARIILTVSPVPLVATYEDRHVLVSTVYSKSVLRVAADMLSKSLPDVAYFPSYEIVVGPHARGQYFDEDLRSVKPEAVEHVMSLFLKHYGGADTVSARYEKAAELVCDEELLDA